VISRIKHVGRFLAHVTKHERIPRWLKVGLIVLLLIPGPIDEALAAMILIPLFIIKRDIMVECWDRAR
jgi:hypothetical protein